MALQVAYERPNTGERWPLAYHRITAVNLNVATGGAEIVVSIYRDALARAGGKDPMRVRAFGAVDSPDDPAYTQHFAPAILDGRNPVRAGYLWLKTTAAYAAALDV